MDCNKTHFETTYLFIFAIDYYIHFLLNIFPVAIFYDLFVKISLIKQEVWSTLEEKRYIKP